MLSRLEWELEQRKQYVVCPVLIPFCSLHHILHTNAMQYTLTHVYTHTLSLHRLAEQHGDLEKNIGQQQSEISKMDDNLSGLQPTLESIRKATLPLQESLGLPLDKRRTENETAQLLPPWVVIENRKKILANFGFLFLFLSFRPLYIFFMQIRTYADVQGISSCHSVMLVWCMCVFIARYVCVDPSISVSISGDVDEAKAFRSSSSHEQSGKTTTLVQ